MRGINKISIIGAGNVGTHVAKRAHELGITVKEVFNRTFSGAQKLADEVGARAVEKLQELSSEVDIVFVAVKDDAIIEVAQKCKHLNGMVVHTSGSFDTAEFSDYFEKFGAFYPLQTFDKDAAVSWKNIPILIESNDEMRMHQLRKLALAFSGNCHLIMSSQRRQLHLAAVFTNNFTNALLGISRQILEEAELPDTLLHPLIEKTFRKALNHHPIEIQTGPAARQDHKVIDAHLELLKEKPEFKEIYRIITAYIIKER